MPKANMLRVVTWNMYDWNERPFNLLGHVIDDLHADVICLQEVPEMVLRNLEDRGYRTFSAKDQMSGEKLSHLLILVRKRRGIVPDMDSHRVETHESSPSTCIAARLFGFSWTMCLESHSVLLRVGKKKVRVVNCHLPAAVPVALRRIRLDEISRAHFGAEPTLFCGDLNTYGAWWRNALAGWIFGVAWDELCVNEIKLLDRFAETHGLRRIFKSFRPRPWSLCGHITHPWTLSNIDHILATHGAFRIADRRRLDARHKSDHRGLLTDLVLI